MRLLFSISNLLVFIVMQSFETLNQRAAGVVLDPIGQRDNLLLLQGIAVALA